MFSGFRKLPSLLGVLFAGAAFATQVPTVSFHDLVARANQIVTGRVVGSTVSWGSEHKYLWTRYEISVDQVIKGERQKTVIVSEPGGSLSGVTMRIAGAVSYAVGEHVALFLETYPSGDKRTVGWWQGKLTFDAEGKAAPGSIATLNGVTESALRTLVVQEMNHKK